MRGGIPLLSSPQDQEERRSSPSGVWGTAPAENENNLAHFVPAKTTLLLNVVTNAVTLST